MRTVEKSERLLELKIQEASYGLSNEERAELRALLVEFPEWVEDESLEMTVASIQLVGLEGERMPTHLMKSIEDEFSRLYPTRSEERTAVVTSKNNFSRLFDTKWLGWSLAGALGVLLLLNMFSDSINVETGTGNPILLTAQQELDDLISSSKDLERASWIAPDPKNKLEFEGEVVWSESKQKGFMKFKGLPVNDPSKETYQLWIFDANREEARPVDGGVFDVAKDEVVIPIDAKLKVKDVYMFAVTVEKPGGVVVSSREPIVSIATLKKA